MTAPDIGDLDPFDLPEWLGVQEVTWSATCGIRVGYAVPGLLTSPEGDELDCDLLAVDEAYPAPVAGDALRSDAHHAWRAGQVHLVTRGGRATLVVPGTAFTADLVLEAVGRLALAVGASPDRYTARLRIGRDRPGSGGVGR